MEGETDDIAMIHSFIELIEDPAPLDQTEVVRRAAGIPISDRQKDKNYLRSYFSSSEDPDRMIRAAQIAAGWLPESLGTVLSALESPDPEIRFAILCALMDASESSMTIVQSQLAPAVWRSMITAKESDVEYMGAELLPAFEPSIIRPLMAETKRSQISAFLTYRLKENGIWLRWNILKAMCRRP